MPKREVLNHTTLSIVVPALNEGQIIGRLLTSLQKQKYKNYELIIVDGGSKDNTISVIKRVGKKIPKVSTVVEKRRGIGLARNVGAAHASGDYLLFLDADVVLDKDFLKNSMAEFEDRFLDVATCYITPISARLIDFVMHEAANVVMNTAQHVAPMAPGFCIFATKRMHTRIGGFDTRLKMSEDFNYIERASRIGKFRVLKSSRIRVSVRRLDKEGRGKLVLKYVYVPIYRTFMGEITKPIFKYEFGKFNKKKNRQDVFLMLENEFVSKSLKHFKRFKSAILDASKKF